MGAVLASGPRLVARVVSLRRAGSRRKESLGRDLLIGAGAGLVAMAATGLFDRAADRLVSREQKRRERRVRDGSPHEQAGGFFGRKILGRKLDRREQKLARGLFTLAYGIAWGLVYAAVRRRVPGASRWLGLPFAVPFFALCDGVIAPLLGLTPTPLRVPWQLNVKELGNHAAWTASAEVANRLGRRLAG